MLIEQPAGHVTTPIMPARPLCYGRVKAGCGRGELVPGCREEFECRGCLFEGSQLAPTGIEIARALTRVYARENHELRERVEALKWLREVEDAKDAVYWSHDSSEDSWDEYVDIHSCARRNAAFPPLDPKKVTSDAMGLKEAGV